MSSVALGSLFALIMGLYFIFKNRQPVEPSIDFSTIAGEDLMTTQLDLARAYMETNNKPLAKPILKAVISKGSATQKKEAKQLLAAVLAK